VPRISANLPLYLSVHSFGTWCGACAPLLVFAPRLLEAKLRGLREYWELAERYVSGFDAKWIRGEPRATADLLGTPDLQSLSDLGNSLEVVRGVRIVPFGLSPVSAFAVASLVPMAPLLRLQFRSRSY
jgi:hypothetical protein